MNTPENLKDLNELIKKVFTFRERFRIYRIRDLKERYETAAYMLYSKLDLKYHDLALKVQKLENKKNLVLPKQYLTLLPFKIKFFKLEPKKENFYNALLLIKKIEEGIK